jgi:hypothetical protein
MTMTSFSLLLQHSLFYGVILGISVCGLFLAGAYLDPEVMLRGYPPDIKAKYGPASARAQKRQTLLGIPVALALFGTLVVAIVRLADLNGGRLTFLAVFACASIMLLVLNLVDLVINDWLIFATIRPKFVVLPGTEGMAGYHDYRFHFRQFLKGVVGSLISGVVIAGITVAVF